MSNVHSRELWNCCHGSETHVITFDNGSEHAVCARCASAYTGPVRELTSADVLMPPRPKCPITGVTDSECADRECELHYMRAPLSLAPVPDGAPVVDTRHADAAYARQVADELHIRPSVAAHMIGQFREWSAQSVPAGWEAIEAGTEETDRAHDADFRAAHDAHMREAYREPWDVQPQQCPSTGDPLTGTYGRTYAESGYLLMQAAGDMFGPATGSTPILLFRVATAEGRALMHAPMGGAVMTHVDTYDTWHAALSALRWSVDHAPVD